MSNESRGNGVHLDVMLTKLVRRRFHQAKNTPLRCCIACHEFSGPNSRPRRNQYDMPILLFYHLRGYSLDTIKTSFQINVYDEVPNLLSMLQEPFFTFPGQHRIG